VAFRKRSLKKNDKRGHLERKEVTLDIPSMIHDNFHDSLGILQKIRCIHPISIDTQTISTPTTASSAPALRDSLCWSWWRRGQSCCPVAAGQVNGMVGTHHGINTYYRRHRSCITQHSTAAANECTCMLCTFSWPVWPSVGASKQRPYPLPYQRDLRPRSRQSISEIGAMPDRRQYGLASDMVRPANHRKLLFPISFQLKGTRLPQENWCCLRLTIIIRLGLYMPCI